MAVTMAARFPSRCRSCGGKVRVGDPISKRNGAWVHGSCPAELATVREARLSGSAPYEVLEERAIERQRRQRADAEYAAGQEDARREKFNREMFGDAYAAAEEFARDLRGLNGEW